MKSRLIECISCPLCEESRNEPYIYETVVVSGENLRLGINKCRTCGLNYVSPRLLQRALQDIYDNHYHEQTIGGAYNTDEAVSLHEYVAFEKYIMRCLPAGGAVLDVGCGVGHLLKRIGANPAFVAEGVEISAWATNEAQRRGLSVRHGDITLLNGTGKSFDCIVFLYVLEHVPDPKEALAIAYDLLKTDGYLMLAVPNLRYFKIANDNVVARRLWHRTLHSEEHFQNFTPPTLQKMVERCGFKPVFWGASGAHHTAGKMGRTIKQVLSVPAMILARCGFNVGGIHLVAQKV
jgi:2-polyprenyl-3-methyl-5-hydroxy-6-metoxy-1,4-benzoquinol methylase